MVSATGKYNYGDDDIAKRVASIEKRLSALESGNRGGYTSIESGTFEINGGVFRVRDQVYIGPVTYGGDQSDGWLFKNAKGQVMFSLEGSSNDDQNWAFRDDSGNLILGSDAGSNQGLARPWLPIPFYNTPPVLNWTTTSATFQAIGIARFCKQLPKIQMDIWATTGSGTTGEVQLLDTSHGIVVGAPIVLGAASNVITFFGSNGLNGNFGEMMTVELQARRTGGAGNVTVTPLGAYNIQS